MASTPCWRLRSGTWRCLVRSSPAAWGAHGVHCGPTDGRGRPPAAGCRKYTPAEQRPAAVSTFLPRRSIRLMRGASLTARGCSTTDPCPGLPATRLSLAITIQTESACILPQESTNATDTHPVPVSCPWKVHVEHGSAGGGPVLRSPCTCHSTVALTHSPLSARRPCAWRRMVSSVAARRVSTT
jgi:hypothetical protein